MQNPTFDPGLTQQYSGPLRRIISQDGTFNVNRLGTVWQDVDPYLYMVSVAWTRFFGIVLAAYTLVNVFFAGIYYTLGPNAIQSNADSVKSIDRFLQELYFSSQTLTTVGFGAISPRNGAANVVAAVEALVGLLGFAVVTGLLFGRVSRPSARIGFSERALISPYQDGASLQFRMVNRRANSLIEPEVTLMMMTVERSDSASRRDYQILKLERQKIMFLPLTWTVVHPITPESPLFEKTAEELEDLQVEFMILVKAWDETFSQTVHQRYSYRYSELVWNARFTPAFALDDHGGMQVHVNLVGAYKTLE